MFIIWDGKKRRNEGFLISPDGFVSDHLNLFGNSKLKRLNDPDIYMTLGSDIVCIKGRGVLDEKMVKQRKKSFMSKCMIYNSNTGKIHSCTECEKCWGEGVIKSQWGGSICDCLFSKAKEDVSDKN